VGVAETQNVGQSHSAGGKKSIRLRVTRTSTGKKLGGTGCMGTTPMRGNRDRRRASKQITNKGFLRKRGCRCWGVLALKGSLKRRVVDVPVLCRESLKEFEAQWKIGTGK